MQQSNFHDYRPLRLSETPVGRGAHRAQHGAAERRRRAGSAADRAGGGERGVRRHRHSACGGCRCGSPEEDACPCWRRARRGRVARSSLAGRARRAAPPARRRRPGRLRDGAQGLPAPALPELPHPRRRAAAVRRRPDARARTSSAAPTARARPACPCATCHADAQPARRATARPCRRARPTGTCRRREHAMVFIGLHAGAALRDDQGPEGDGRQGPARDARARRRRQARAAGAGTRASAARRSRCRTRRWWPRSRPGWTRARPVRPADARVPAPIGYLTIRTSLRRTGCVE